jgi:hypothetical protein
LLLENEEFRALFQSCGVDWQYRPGKVSVTVPSLWQLRAFTVCRVNSPSTVTQSFTKLRIRRLDLPFLVLTTRS